MTNLIGRLLDRLSTCPACRHDTDVPGCGCTDRHCACAAVT